MEQAREGLEELRKYADSVIAIPNDRVLQSVPRNTPVHEAFSVADDVLLQAVQGITDIIIHPGQINVDFADVRSIMKGMGHAVMGIGMGEGPMRALTAAQRAVSNPLLENSSMQGARSIVVNITGGPDLSLAEASEATSFITRVAHPDANVIYGIVTDESMGNAVKVTVIATGFGKSPRKAATTPVDLANYMTTPQTPAAAQAAAAAAGGADFYRKTPNAKVASGGSRFDLDVPAFLRRKGSEPASGGE
jgi:cell division protein FtsZ